MEFNNLATTWDEAMPLGNATIGSLVWRKGENLRISIDRSDLCDLRQLDEFKGENFSFQWLYDQVLKEDCKPVLQRFDFPYNGFRAPLKYPEPRWSYLWINWRSVKRSFIPATSRVPCDLEIWSTT